MTVNQLYEILGKYIDIGAGECAVQAGKRDQFKTRKEHREWLKSKPSEQGVPTFHVDEVIFAAVNDDDGKDTGSGYVVLLPSYLIKDENKAVYYLPSEDFVKGNRDTPPAKKLELAAKVTKGSKKGFKKSTKATKGSKKK